MEMAASLGRPQERARFELKGRKVGNKKEEYVVAVPPKVAFKCKERGIIERDLQLVQKRVRRRTSPVRVRVNTS